MIEIVLIQFTNDSLINQYVSLFVNVATVLVASFGALSLFGAK